MRYWLVMPAAGSGRRFGAAPPKQYAPLAGRTVIEWALAPFLEDARCVHAVVALAPGDRHWHEVTGRLAAAAGGTARLTSVTGGEARSHSVRLGLAALAAHAAADDWVLVHDAARPCLDPTDLGRLIAALSGHEVGGLLAIPSADTLKRAVSGADGVAVGETLDRSHLWRALTPQMFRFGRLCAALDRAQAAGRTPTDEAQALEWSGARALLVEGTATNLKVTTPDDLALAAAVLHARSGGAPGSIA